MIWPVIGALLLGTFVGYGFGVLVTEEKQTRPRPKRQIDQPVIRAQREEFDAWMYAADQLGLPRRTVADPGDWTA